MRPLILLILCAACVDEVPWGTRDGDATPEPTPDLEPGDDDDDDDESPEPTPPLDSDGDGVPDSEDCAPGDPSVSPGRPELCNGLDDNCDNSVDEGLANRWYLDADGDGYGDTDQQSDTCSPLTGWVLVPGDCADADPAVFPGSTARVDGLDSDCDGARDWLWDLWVTADDAFEFCVDDETSILGSGSNWVHGVNFQIWLESGDHVLGIKGWDTGMVITAAIAHASISDGSTWVTDATWRYDPNPAAASDSRSGWCGPYFDDSAWNLVNVIGPAFVTGPWNGAPTGFPATTGASWVWDHYPVNLNTQYLRKGFTLP